MIFIAPRWFQTLIVIPQAVHDFAHRVADEVGPPRKTLALAQNRPRLEHRRHLAEQLQCLDYVAFSLVE